MPGRIFAFSFLVGLVQVALSYGAGIAFDTDTVDQYRFGYIDCYNWSASYLLVVPTILSACIPNSIFLYRRSRFKRAHRLQFLLLIALALSYASVTAGREFLEAITDSNPGKYVEWTAVGAGAWNATNLSRMQRISWHVLFFLGYANYFVTSIIGSSGAFGALWYFALVSRNSRKVLRIFSSSLGLLQPAASPSIRPKIR